MQRMKFKNICVVFARDLNEILSSNSFKLIVAIFITASIAASIYTIFTLNKIDMIQEKAVNHLLGLHIGFMIYLFSMIPLVTNILVYAGISITKEKVNRNIESLLATRLTPDEICIGKSLAIFLPGYIIGAVTMLFILLIVNFVSVIPGVGYFFVPGPSLVTALFINPLLFLGLTLFTIQLSMITSPELAITPPILLGIGLIFWLSVGLSLNLIDLTTWPFYLYHLGGALLIWIVVYLFSRLIPKERIVLSR